MKRQTDQREVVSEFKGSNGDTDRRDSDEELDSLRWRLGFAFKGQGRDTASMVVETKAGQRAWQGGASLSPNGELCISMSVQRHPATPCQKCWLVLGAKVLRVRPT